MQNPTSIHQGPYTTIPNNASPGLQFLARFLPSLDSVSPSPSPSNHPIASFFTPTAQILTANNPPSTAQQATPLMDVRSRHLSHLHHHLHLAWDIDLTAQDRTPNRNPPTGDGGSDGEGPVNATEKDLYAPPPDNYHPGGMSTGMGMGMKRTVMFEATSETILKSDPDQFPVKVRELNILDLEGTDECDLKIVQMRVYMDSRPVQARAAELHAETTFGASKREAEPE